MRVCYWSVTVPYADKLEFERILYRGAKKWAVLDKTSENELAVTYETVQEDDETELGMDFYLYVRRTEEAAKSGVRFLGMFTEHKNERGQEVRAHEVISTGSELLAIECPDDHAPGIVFQESELELVENIPTLTEEAKQKYATYFSERKRLATTLGLPDVGWHMPLLFQEQIQ